MKIAYFDCFAGISGDMILGALIDLGVDAEWLAGELHKLPLEGYRLESRQVAKCGIQAVQFSVILNDAVGGHLADSEYIEVDQPQERPLTWSSVARHDDPEPTQRSLSEILALIANSQLSERVKSTAKRIFTRLGEAESHVHGIPLEQVHFHEVGGVDAIMDIVGSAIALERLGIDSIYASPLHLGSGYVRSQHGLLPVPAPATAHLITGVPAYSSEARGELVTPTGAAILTSIASGFGPMPLMNVQAVGYGAEARISQHAAHLSWRNIGQWIRPKKGSLAGARSYPDNIGLVGPAGYHESPALVLSHDR
jgi:uncharacterized protein (TIGR00299 family) protein